VGELPALFQRFDWYSLIDVAIVALIFFALLYLVRGTQAAPLLRGVIILGVFFIILATCSRLCVAAPSRALHPARGPIAPPPWYAAIRQ